jgi:uncharacterized protein YcfJ
MTNPAKWRKILFPAALVVISGCAGDEFVVYTPETPAERELRVSRENLQRTVGEGGVAGAGLGAALGAATGGVQGAFAGAQIGRLGGAAAGGYVKQLQEEYASQEQVLDAVVADLRTTNARMDDSIAAMQSVLAERSASAEANTARDERLQVEVADTLTAAQQQEQFFASTRSLLISDGMNVGRSVDPELARLRDRVASMQRIANSLAGT